MEPIRGAPGVAAIVPERLVWWGRLEQGAELFEGGPASGLDDGGRAHAGPDVGEHHRLLSIVPP